MRVLAKSARPRGCEQILEGSGKQSLSVQAEGQRLGSFSQTADRTVPPALPVFLGGSVCQSVEFSQDRRLPPGLEFSVQPPSPRAELSLEQGSDGVESGLYPRGAGFS